MSRVDKRPGSRFYYYFWRDENGREQAKSLKTEDKLIADLKKGEEDKKRHYAREGVPFKDARWSTAKEDFLKGYQAGKTKEGHQQSLSLFERYAPGFKPSSITYSKAKGFRDWLHMQTSKHGRPYQPASINIHIRNLTTFFNECVRFGYCTESPFKEVKQVPDTKRTPKYLKKDEIQAVINEAHNWPEDKLLMALFFLYTGIRLSELVYLRWPAIDLERGLFYLHGSEEWEPKDREEHAIGLNPELLKRLRRHPKGSEFVFPGVNGGRRCRYSLGRLFNRLYRRAGVSMTGVHLLRHTWATHCGLNVKTKQRIMGHSDVRTTMRYDHITEEDRQAAANVSYFSPRRVQPRVQ